MAKALFLTGDKVIVRKGNHKGTISNVEKVDRKKSIVYLRDVKPKFAKDSSKLSPIKFFNVMHCDASSKPSKIYVKVDEKGRKIRYLKTNHHAIDV